MTEPRTVNSDTFFPNPETHFRRSSPLQLIKHGFQLHAATFYGPLRTSKQFRFENPNWMKIVTQRFLMEYGLNLVLLLIGQAFIILFYAHSIIVAEIFLVLFLPLLTIIQLFIDRFRSDSKVFYDPLHSSGMSVKTYVNKDKEVIAWSFFNHYSLPIGLRKGVDLRQAIHSDAKKRKITLVCHAQNDKIADYYLNEHPGGESLGGSRPLLVWSYSPHGVKDFMANNVDVFGVKSIRNTGQLPATNFKNRK